MVVIKRTTKRGAKPPTTSTVPTPTATPPGTGNAIFETELSAYALAKSQSKLIAEKLKTENRHGKHQNLVHLLRSMIEADGRGAVISTANRAEFLDTDDTTIPQTEQLLAELETTGYLDITTRRPKNHDYRPSQKARDTWNQLRLYEGASPIKPRSYSATPDSVDHYLLPFAAQTYLDEVSSGRPEDLPALLSTYRLLPCDGGTVGVGSGSDPWTRGWGKRANLLDFRDHEFGANDYKDDYHRRLFTYLGDSELGAKLDTLLGMAPRSTDVLEPRWSVKNSPTTNARNSVIFRDARGGHYEVPEQLLRYLYNNYFGEDLDLRISRKPVNSAVRRSGVRDDVVDESFVIVVNRIGRDQPLLIYLFDQVHDQLATIR